MPNIARIVSGTDSGKLTQEAAIQCPLAIGSYIWIREIDELARKHFGSGLARLHHYGTYSCRKQKGNSGENWSEHAFANAWDVTAFELSNGEYISVRKHWKDGSPAQKAFLRGVHGQACKVFQVTLGPDYNAAHHDHFHVDMGPSRACH